MSQVASFADEVREERRLLAQARSIRRRAGVTQERMAREVPVDRVTLGRWETLAMAPTGQKRERYLELLRALEEILAS